MGFLDVVGFFSPIPWREVCNQSEQRTMAAAASAVRGGAPRPHAFVHF
jgi:hypothetical protein